ncbi:MAG: DUF3025 domain-containing protein [Tahibacter sp.]
MFATPPLAQWSEYADWLQSPHFPEVSILNSGWNCAWRFVEQTPQLLADKQHYEQRIHTQAAIATRADNWHDLLNALIWRRYAPIKAALNARQVAEIALVGAKQRSRAQCALTHFDEGGVIVIVRDRQLLPLWDAHDWHGLFWGQRAAWEDGRIAAQVFGHALLEMALQPCKLITGKALPVYLPSGSTHGDVVACIADAINRGSVLNDPQELRPLPISGIPGWHAEGTRESFYREAPCFQPLRAGREYPPALEVSPPGSLLTLSPGPVHSIHPQP